MRRSFLAAVLFGAALFGGSRQSHALSRNMKVFALTSTYGVMAGTLTGVASLAFYSEPRQKLRNIAMGASLGLYVGIMLGAYMVYAVDDSPRSSRPDEDEVDRQDPENPLNLEDSGQGAKLYEPRLLPLLAYDPQSNAAMAGIQWRF